MLDIKFVRENPEVVKQNIRNKFQDSKLELVDKVLELIKRTERLSRRLRLSVLRETRSPNRSVLLWAREKEKRQKRLKNRLLHPEHVSRNFPRERKRLRKSF